MITLETIRPGVIFDADAAASFRRLEAEVGTIPCNSTWRDPVLQARMHAASVAYENGTAPYPGHSYAVDPDDSYHCKGQAFDSPRSKSIRPAARRHGWVHVTRAGEEHHLERRASLDQHISDPDPRLATTEQQEEEDDMKLPLVITVSHPAPDNAQQQIYWSVDLAARTKALIRNGVELDWRRNLGVPEYVNQSPAVLDGYIEIAV